MKILKILVRKELAVVKDELKNIKMASGSKVCSEACTRVGVGLGSGTFAPPLPSLGVQRLD